MFKSVKWLTGLLRPYCLLVLAGSLLVALTVLGNTGLLATSALLLSKAAQEPEILLLMPLVTGVRFFGIGRALLRYAERLINHSIAFRILGYLRAAFYKRLEPLVPNDFPNYTEGKLYNQFITDINTLQYFYLRAVSVPLGSLCVYIVCAVFLWQYQPSLSILLLLAQLVTGLLLPYLAVSYTSGDEEKLQAIQETLSEQFIDFQKGQMDIVLSGYLQSTSTQLKGLDERMTRLQNRIAAKKAFLEKLVGCLSHATMLVALGLVGGAVVDGRVQGVEVAMLALLILGSFEAVGMMPEAAIQMNASLKAAEGLRAVYEKKPSYSMDTTVEHGEGLALSMEAVTFHYHQKGRRLLENFNLTIPFGSHLAIVGESGSGKSSVARLLTGLWRPDEGVIRLGGCPLEAIDVEERHRLIGSVSQESYFFYASIRDNMRLVNERVSDEAIWQALAMVEMDKHIEQLPGQLDCILAENASVLSGGQRQRLAIARMLVGDPQIVILDEALQKIDFKMAQRILKRLMIWGKERTMIFISHSLQGFEEMNFIYAFSHGKITEQGSHQELMRLENGYYRQLYELEQAQF